LVNFNFHETTGCHQTQFLDLEYDRNAVAAGTFSWTPLEELTKGERWGWKLKKGVEGKGRKRRGKGKGKKRGWKWEKGEGEEAWPLLIKIRDSSMLDRFSF